MNIVFVNTFSKGAHHEMYNASILKILSEQNRHILAFSDKKTLGRYMEMCEIHNSIKNTPIWVFGMGNRLVLFVNYLWSSLMNILILLFSQSDDALVFVFNNAFSCNLLNSLNRWMKRNVIICCHGELELLLEKEENTSHLGSLARLLRKNVKHLFHYSNCSLRFIVAGDVLKEKLLSLTQNTDLNIYSVDHPYIFDKQYNRIVNAKNEIIRLGTVGALSKNKGGDYYINLVQKCLNLKIAFFVIGIAPMYYMEQLEKRGVSFPCKEYSFCPREVYDTYVRNLDFILFFYPSDAYQLTASGAVFDSLRNEVPILALKNDYFSYLFDKFGHFGYLFDSVEEMSSFIHSDQLQQRHVFDFKSIKSKLEPWNFVKSFERIIG